MNDYRFLRYSESVHMILRELRSVLLFVAILASCTIASTARAQDLIPSTPALGFHTHRADSLHLKAAQEGGASFVVVVFSWRDIEPVEGYVYWENTDAALRAAEHYGLEVVARLDQPPDWALAEEGETPWQVDAYAAFARRVAQRYGDRLSGVIIWNEPNLGLEWNREQPDPVGYAALLLDAYSAVKEVAPDLPVLLAGLAFSEGDGDQAVNDLDYLEALYENGAGEHFDVLAAHPYGFGRPPEDAPSTERLNFRRLELHREIMERYADGDKPVWITEMGWRTGAPNAADAWQVVDAETQAAYSVRAIEWVEEQYPWLERMAFWELNADADDHGYAFWHGEGNASEAYQMLADRYAQSSKRQNLAPLTSQSHTARNTIELLAPDVIVRLGDLGTLHPHWVHLRGEEGTRPVWTAEFFLSPAEASAAHDLVLELMQIDQPTNLVSANGAELGRLVPRTRPDPTSTWVTQRFPIPAEVLRPGVNRLTIEAGMRSTVRQQQWWRRENMQVRNVRMVPALLDESSPIAAPTPEWRPRQSPGSWAEVHRLRLMEAAGETDLFVAGNRRSHLWRMKLSADGEVVGAYDEGRDADLAFLDIARIGDELVAATDRGLYIRRGDTARWLPVLHTPEMQANTVIAVDGIVYAGFEAAGVWRASSAGGLWEPSGLEGHSVLDLASAPSGPLYAGTAEGVYFLDGDAWVRLPDFPDVAYSGAYGRAAGEFVTRLYVGSEGDLVARNQDRLWLLDASGGWTTFGPEALQGTIFSVFDCCAPGRAFIGSNHNGLWRRNVDGTWSRVDDGFFSDLELTGGAVVGNRFFVAAHNGLYTGDGSAEWRPVNRLAPTVTDLLVTEDGSTWIAGTPAGVWRSVDDARSWEPVSPPWVVWELAVAVDGRLFVARADGVAYTDTPLADTIEWQETAGLDSVTFFDVSPHPNFATRVWSGSWGNNIGVSEDGGASMQPLHNGLETLSVLDILWHETPGQVTVGTIAGVYRTDDGGASWFKLPGELTEQTVYALYQTSSGSILAGAADGLWTSDDYGVTWTRSADLPATTVLHIGAFEVAGQRRLWAGTEGSGLWFSDDGGRSWQFGGLAGRTVHALQVNAEGRLIAATDDGLYASDAPRE